MLPWMAVCCGAPRPTCRWCFISIVGGESYTHEKNLPLSIHARSRGRNADTHGKPRAKEGALFEAILSLSRYLYNSWAAVHSKAWKAGPVSVAKWTVDSDVGYACQTDMAECYHSSDGSSLSQSLAAPPQLDEGLWFVEPQKVIWRILLNMTTQSFFTFVALHVLGSNP